MDQIWRKNKLKENFENLQEQRENQRGERKEREKGYWRQTRGLLGTRAIYEGVAMMIQMSSQKLSFDLEVMSYTPPKEHGHSHVQPFFNFK
jgi:hypothetical protein